MVNAPPGSEYELFVQGIYQALLNTEEILTILVERNKKIRGKSGSEHQIDLYWEFSLAGQNYSTAIECKDYKSRISIGKIRDFHSVLNDIPNLNGIFATTVGYQSGAKDYAKHNGIQLQEIRHPQIADWNNLIKNVQINIKILIPYIHSVNVIKLGATPKKELSSSSNNTVFDGRNKSKILFDERDQPIANFDELFLKLPQFGAPFFNRRFTLDYPNHKLKFNGRVVEIDALEFVYDIQTHSSESTIEGEKIAHAIIVDAISGKSKFIRKDHIF